MPVSKYAVKQWVERQLRDHSWLKSLPEKKIDAMIRKLPVQMTFHGEARKHQKVCFYIGAKRSCFLFFANMGLGKTKVMLDIIYYRKLVGHAHCALVIVPNVTNMYSWETEVRKLRPELKICVLNGSSEERLDAILDVEADVYVINLQGLLYLCTDASSRGRRSKRKINEARVWALAQRFDMLVIDEIHKLKSHRSTSFQILDKMADVIKFRYGLTGTPHGRDPHDLWAQFKIVDRGETLGKYLGYFRAAFFTEHVNRWGGREYTFLKRRKKKLHRLLQNRSIVYTDEECVDLPPIIYKREELQLPDTTTKYYMELRNALIEEHKRGKSKSTVIENAFIRMRQLASGYMTIRGTGAARIVDFPENPKIDALMEIIDSATPHKLVVFHEYIHTGDLIEKRLKREKISYARLYGATKDKQGAVRKFVEDEKCRVFLVNHDSGGTGLNLQVARYAVFVESPVSPITRMQAEKRIHRHGQRANRVYIYDLVMRNTVDEKILEYVREGKDLLKAILTGKEDLELTS